MPEQRPPASVPAKAVILAAGVGQRLWPVTESRPKPLLPVNGTSILHNALAHLAELGVREVVLVVGHLGHLVRRHVDESPADLAVTWIESPDHRTTNNVYSLWLARDHLRDDVFVLEGDVFFDGRLLPRLVDDPRGSVMAVAGYKREMSGTVVRADGSGRVVELVDASGQSRDFDYADALKTVNIHLLRREFLDQFVPALDEHVRAGRVTDYYEIVMRPLIEHGTPAIFAVRCDDLPWYEIDNRDDWLSAEYLFADADHRYQRIAHEHGGYWRYGLTDHALLYNVYFPPPPFFEYFKRHLVDLVRSYPAGHDTVAQHVAALSGQPPRCLVISNGLSEIIKIIAGPLRYRFIIPTPSFNEYENAAGAEQVVRFPLAPSTFHLDVDAFAERAIDSGVQAAIVVTPNNPTSVSVPRADLLRLEKRLADHDCLLFVDESFVDFVDRPEEASLTDYVQDLPHLVILKSLSKVYGIAGLRLGYLVAGDKSLARSVRAQLPIWNINGFAESFLRLVTAYRGEFLQSCAHVRTARDDLYQKLLTIDGLVVFKPDANFVFCRLPDGGPSAPEVARQLFARHRILIKDCANKPLPDADRYLRLACRTPAENARLVECLRQAVGPDRTTSPRD